MTVKFKKGRYRDRALGTHGLLRNPADRKRLPVKQRLIIIYLGLLFFVIVLYFAHSKLELASPTRRPPLEGEGTIVRKESENTGTPQAAYFVHVRVVTPDGETLTQRTPTDAASWRLVEEGNAIHVVYRLSDEGKTLRVRRLMLPPAEPAQNEELTQ